MAQGEPDQDDLYRTGQPVAERVCGKLSWSFPGRVFESGTTVDLDRNAGSGGRLPAGVQSGEAAQPVGLREPGGFCGAELSIPSSGRASPSLRRGWTRNKQKHKPNHVPGLTHGLGQKSEAGHLHYDMIVTMWALYAIIAAILWGVDYALTEKVLQSVRFPML